MFCQFCRFLSTQVVENDQALQPGNWLCGLIHATVIQLWGAFPRGGPWPWQRAPFCSGSWETRVLGPGWLLADSRRKGDLSKYSPQILAGEGSHLRARAKHITQAGGNPPQGGEVGPSEEEETPLIPKLTPLEGEVLLASFLQFALRGDSPRQEETRSFHCWKEGGCRLRQRKGERILAANAAPQSHPPGLSSVLMQRQHLPERELEGIAEAPAPPTGIPS